MFVEVEVSASAWLQRSPGELGQSHLWRAVAPCIRLCLLRVGVRPRPGRPAGRGVVFVRCLRVEACPSFCLLGGDPLLLTGSGIFGLVGATAGRLAFSGQA